MSWRNLPNLKHKTYQNPSSWQKKHQGKVHNFQPWHLCLWILTDDKSLITTTQLLLHWDHSISQRLQEPGRFGWDGRWSCLAPCGTWLAVFEQPEEFPYGPFSKWCKQTQERYHLGSCWHISKTSLSSAKMFWVRCSHQSQKTSVLLHHCIGYIYCIDIYIYQDIIVI